MFGFGSKLKAAQSVEAVCAQLAKRHANLLGDAEVFVSATNGFAADKPHPEPLTRRGQPQPIRGDDHLTATAAAHLRLAGVQSALGMSNEQFTELPVSTTGYIVAHTNTRLFIFDGTGHTYLTESSVKGIWMQPVHHDDGLCTLVFKQDDARVAVATRRESVDLTTHFIATFPDRRAKARSVVASNQHNIGSF